MEGKRNQIVFNDAQHRALKRLATEAGIPMPSVVELLVKMAEERVKENMGWWFELGESAKEFVVNVSRQPALTILAAIHLEDLKHIDQFELEQLLKGGDTGRDILGLLIDASTKEQRRQIIDGYDLQHNTIVAK